MAAIVGSLRRVDCTEAEILTPGGVCLTFRLDPKKMPLMRNLIEVDRKKLGGKPRESILIDGKELQRIRAGAILAILKHRETMRMPHGSRVIRVQPKQLHFSFR